MRFVLVTLLAAVAPIAGASHSCGGREAELVPLAATFAARK